MIRFHDGNPMYKPFLFDKISAKECDVPAYREIGSALKSRKTASLAVRRFMTTNRTVNISQRFHNIVMVLSY